MKSQKALRRDQTVTDKVGQADVKVATLLSQNNIPLDLADELTPLFPDIFPDSKIAKDFSSRQTKTVCITNAEVAPYSEGEMIPSVVRHPFSLVIDGSTDNGMEEINPMRVRIFDCGQVSMQFLDLQCVSTEDTLQTLFLKMDDALFRHLVEWENCVGVAVDSTSLTVCGDPIKTHVRDKNQATYIVDCGCHIVHNTASRASDAFEQVSGFSVEEMATDLFHWFDNSTKQKMDPVQYHTFCDITYQQAVKHVDTRWLNLETTVSRILQQYGSLKSYFLSKDDKAPYFGRLRVLFEDPMTEVYLLFYQSALQTFLQFNAFLEREDPVIPIVHAQMQSFLQKLASKFVRVQTIKEAKGDFMNMHYKALDVQVPDNSLFIGFGAKTLLNKLLNEGSISGHQASKFYEGVRAFYSRAFSYALGQLPLDDRLLRNAAFVNFRRRENAALSEVEYFIDRFSALLPFQSPQEMDKLADEFSAYQLMNDEVVPQSVWTKAKVSEDGLHRLDVIWQHLSLLKAPDDTLLLPRLSKVATLVLVIPHSSS
ncbi:uncharacterized protein [Diadema antillarum]|uniref:uncharacterized protein n=1 Tax=Diadema antillarum TaxID=105358 RepID=UPI003A87ECBD